MKLLDYLKENNLSDAAFAEHLGGGLSESAVRKWKYGERTPRLRDLVRIEEVTNGTVTPSDFLPQSERPAEAPSPFPPEAAE
ncbi:MAG: helix-turn-helix domain-containing protein [Methylocystis sp.]|uniref:helix-turn-helix domain-containing protein n=1 Tax=Methylocystis sp. TaxID=1911079 RepID=UPI003DA4F7E2